MDKPPVPVIDKIHQRVYRAASQPGALNMRQWHCGTAHCRAGHVVILAGAAGRALEIHEWENTRLGDTGSAAEQIYEVSSPIATMTDPFMSSLEPDVALADMKRCADEEAARFGVLEDDDAPVPRP